MKVIIFYKAFFHIITMYFFDRINTQEQRGKSHKTDAFYYILPLEPHPNIRIREQGAMEFIILKVALFLILN